MQNGFGLSGENTSQQLAILKHPGNNNQYFVFTTGDNGNTNGHLISYSIVDMSLGNIGNNGLPLGAVLQNQKNIVIVNNLGSTFHSEAISVVPNFSDGSYWVLIPNGQSLYSYEVNNQGFNNGSPIVSNLNFPTSLNNDNYYSIKVSPKLNNRNFTNYFCISLWENPVNTNVVYSFNSNTGQITNDFFLTINGLRAYLPEFNSDSSVLFLSHGNIFAVDLLNSTPTNINNMQIYSGLNAYTSMQRNKYGNIYISTYGRNFLGRIINPDVYSNNISVDMNDLNLGSGITAYGLPPLIERTSSPSTECSRTPNIVLNNPESNVNYLYRAYTIIMQDDYSTDSNNQEIIARAGESVTLLPNTNINYGSNFLAEIKKCEIVAKQAEEYKSTMKQSKISLSIDLDKNIKELDEIKVSPNPASSFIKINTGQEKLISWEMYDMSGRNVLKGNSKDINVQSLPKSSYLLMINTEKQKVTKKIIVQ